MSYDTSYPPSLWGGRGDPADLTITVPSPTAMVVGVPTTIQTRLRNDSDNDWGQITNTGVWTSPSGALSPGDMKYETKDLGGTDWLVVNLVMDGNGGLTVTGTYPIPPNLDASSDVRVTINQSGINRIDGRSTIRKNGKVLTYTDYVYNVTDSGETVIDEPDETEPDEPDPDETEPDEPTTFTAVPVDRSEMGNVESV